LIIISEWMGYFLLYESMLDTVIFARDKWLVKDGLIFPDKAKLYLCAMESGSYVEHKLNFWDKVYGFDMSCVKELAIMEPDTHMCDHSKLISDSCCILNIDAYTVTKEDLDFNSKFQLRFIRNDHCHALVSYFTIEFSKSIKPIRFSTGPRDRYTHWKQTCFYFDNPMVVCKSEVLHGTISVQRNQKNPRDLDAMVVTTFEGKYDNVKNSRGYRLR